jgi:translin
MLDRSDDLRIISECAHDFFSNKHAARERALQLSRGTIQLASKSIRSTHRNELEQADALLNSARGLVEEMMEIKSDHPDIYYTGFVQDAQKEYVEAILTLALIADRPFTLPNEIGISLAAYLNGLGETIGEMRRYLLDSLRRGETSRCETVLDIMDQIHTELFTMDFPEAITGGLRRTTDAMRGILERTRGDLTNALRQQKLSEQIDRLMDKT